MSKNRWNFLVLSSTVLGSILAISYDAIAIEKEYITKSTQPKISKILNTRGLNTNLQTDILEESPEKSNQLFTNFSDITLDKKIISSNSPESKGTLEKINQYNQSEKQQPQVTSVSQLEDVTPGDWAFEALRSLVERYDCISGFPNGTFRGNRATTRFEFAAGLNACLNQIEGLISANVNEFATRQDLETLQRLLKEFEPELATLRQRIDNLEARTASLEANQFSINTKLKGEIAFTASGAFGDEKANGSGEDIDDNIILNNRVRLNFDTSFTGKDLLKVRLDALNTIPLGQNVTGTNMTRLAFERNTNNDFDIGKLFYRFPVSKRLRFHIDATGGRFNLNASNNFNKPFANPVTGSISRFGRFNPIYIQGALGAGVTGVYDFNKSLSLSLGYLARNASDPSDDNGLFNGSYAALAQLDFKPSKQLDLGLTYVRAYYPAGRAFVSGATGSRLANAPFGQIATSANHFGFQSSFRVSKTAVISGWAGLTNAQAEDDGVGGNGVQVEENDDATIFNWAVTLALPDLGKKGSLAGFVIGQPPQVTDNDSGPENNDKSWHLEGFYRYALNQNISLTPGLLVILNPEGDDNNDPIYVGTFRTVFKF